MRKKDSICIPDRDVETLNELLRSAMARDSKDREFLEKLKNEIERARIVPWTRIPNDVVTMNSRVLLEDMDTHEEYTFQIVFPADADLEAGKISVLAPVGTGLLGYKVGDIVAWPVPAGVRKLKIKEMLYQPEAHGMPA